MSIVNYQTGEIVDAEVVEDELTAEQARHLTNEIQATLRAGHDLIIRAYEGRAWIALGYQSWDAYCAAEFTDARMVRLDREQRREIVLQMRQRGMTQSAIASGLGVAPSTIALDSTAINNYPDVEELPDRAVGLDGKSRPTRRQTPAEPPAQSANAERAHQEAELINAFGSIVRRSLTPKNVATLTPKARARLISILNDALNTLQETSS